MNSARRANTARASSVNRSSLLTRSTSTKSLFDAPSPSLEESEVKGNKSRRGGSISVSSGARNEIMRDYYAYRRDSFSPVCVNSVANSQFLWENPEKDYEIIHKGNWVLLGVGSPSEKRYALLHDNHYEEYMNIFKLKRRGLYPTHCSLVNSEACQDESVEKDSMNQIAFLLNQLVYRVSVDYAIEMNDDILQELRSFQEDCWENENNITEKRYELLLRKQMNHRKCKKKVRGAKTPAKKNTVAVKKKTTTPSTTDSTRESKMSTPFYWDHMTSISKPNAFPFTIPVDFYSVSTNDSLTSRVAELNQLQTDTIKREKKELKKKKRTGFESSPSKI